MSLLRLLLIEPPFYRLHKLSYGLCKYPLGLGYLAAAVTRDSLAEVQVVNGDFHQDPELFSVPYLTGEGYRSYRENVTDLNHPSYAGLRRQVRNFRPHVVGISVKTPVLASALMCARIAKEEDPDTLVVLGGPHATATMGEVLVHKAVDVVTSGEGEQTIAGLIRAVSEDSDFKNVRGISFRRAGKIISTSPQSKLADLDGLPFPYRYAAQVLADYNSYPLKAFGHVFSSRGCSFRCTYCSSPGIWGHPVRFRSEENILAELTELRHYGLTRIHFDDDTFGLKKKRLVRLCNLIEKASLNLTFGCETHVSLISEATVTAMVRAGFDKIQLGLESGDDSILKKINKNFTVQEAVHAAGLVKSAGLGLEIFIMVGFPDETEDSLRATLRLLEKIECDKIIYSLFTPYPGTPLFDECRRLGLINEEYDYSRFSHQSPENSFCPGIGKERFRILASEMESLVFQKNAASRAHR